MNRLTVATLLLGNRLDDSDQKETGKNRKAQIKDRHGAKAFEHHTLSLETRLSDQATKHPATPPQIDHQSHTGFTARLNFVHRLHRTKQIENWNKVKTTTPTR